MGLQACCIPLQWVMPGGRNNPRRPNRHHVCISANTTRCGAKVLSWLASHACAKNTRACQHRDQREGAMIPHSQLFMTPGFESCILRQLFTIDKLGFVSRDGISWISVPVAFVQQYNMGEVDNYFPASPGMLTNRFGHFCGPTSWPTWGCDDSAFTVPVLAPSHNLLAPGHKQGHESKSREINAIPVIWSSSNLVFSEKNWKYFIFGTFSLQNRI